MLQRHPLVARRYIVLAILSMPLFSYLGVVFIEQASPPQSPSPPELSSHPSEQVLPSTPSPCPISKGTLNRCVQEMLVAKRLKPLILRTLPSYRAEQKQMARLEDDLTDKVPVPVPSVS
jgi:hypothetical protein